MPVYVADLNDTPPAIGQPWKGGIYFGEFEGKSLIANTQFSGSYTWGPGGEPISTSSTDGKANTELLAGRGYPVFVAVKNSSQGGYTDWYVPARDQLNQLMVNIGSMVQGDETLGRWSSSHRDSTQAWTIRPDASVASSLMTFSRMVVPVREEPGVINKSPKSIHVADWGLWKAVQSAWVYDSGTWKKFFEGGPTTKGQAYGGGYYYGDRAYSDGFYHMVVSPKSSEQSSPWSSNTGSLVNGEVDGLSNTIDNYLNFTPPSIGKMANDYSISSGFPDWFVPAYAEFVQIYNELKPTTANNGSLNGFDPYSIPVRFAAVTTTDPAMTNLPDFQSTGSQAFQATQYWTSSSIGNGCIAFVMVNGNNQNNSKATSLPTRLIRKIKRSNQTISSRQEFEAAVMAYYGVQTLPPFSTATITSSTGPFAVRVVAQSGTMSGSSWGTYFDTSGSRAWSRHILHALPSATHYDDSIGSIVLVILETGPSSGNTVSVTRNGFTSTGGTTFARRYMTKIIYWDSSLNKAMQCNPSIMETPYEWIPFT